MDAFVRRYKNILLPLAIIAGFFWGFKQFYSLSEAKISRTNQAIAELTEKIELGREIVRKERELSQARGNFISLDSYKFMPLISDYAQASGLAVIS